MIIFASLLQIDMEKQAHSLSDWIDEKVMRGYYTFTIEDMTPLCQAETFPG